MKNKFLILFIGIISFLGLSEVKAETYNFNYSYSGTSSSAINNYNTLKSNLSSDREIISKMYDDLYSYYEDNYKDSYPYYYIKLSRSTEPSNPRYRMILVYFNQDIVYFTYNDHISSGYFSGDNVDSNYNYIQVGVGEIYYDYSQDGAYVLPINESSGVSTPRLGYYMLTHGGEFQTLYHFFYSNINFKFYSSNASDKLVINNYAFSGENKTINVGDNIPLLQEDMGLDIIKDSSLPSSSYTEINLNNYPYVALALKDYSNTNEFVTNVYVKGQYCLTPVYNYGMTERKNVLTGSQIERCSLVYDNFTPIRTYILENDIKNNAIYYLKAYDISHDNIVRVDSSIFDITYITEETKDNPYIMVGGKSYPAIAYDDLTDSATISEENNYVSGGSCALGDMNCVSTITGQSFTFSDIFTSPLEILKDVWSAIVKVFELITMLISLLPPVLQAFLYMSFMLAIILGLIKILL